MIFRGVLKDYIHGALYDRRFAYYRRELSKLSTVYLYYLGSVLVNNVHLIYFTSSMYNYAKVFVTSMHWGEGIIIDCGEAFFMVVVCRSCCPVDEVRVNCCLKRMRKHMITFLHVLPSRCRSFVGVFSGRDMMLARLARTEEPVTFRKLENTIKLYLNAVDEMPDGSDSETE